MWPFLGGWAKIRLTWPPVSCLSVFLSGKNHSPFITYHSSLMKQFLFLGFLLLPFLGAGQVVDTAGVRREVDSLVQVCRELVRERKHVEALDVIEAAEQVALDGFGRESAEYAKCAYNHGRVFHLWGKYPQADTLYFEAKNIREKVLGKEHLDYATSAFVLANLYSTTGRYPEAESLYLESRTIREKIDGNENIDYIWSTNNLANLYRKIGRYSEAEPLYLEVKDMRKKALGAEHPQYAWVLDDLACLYDLLGRYDEAEPLFLEALSIQEKVSNKEDPDYAMTLNNLGILYLNTARYDAAKSLYIQALAIKEKVYGKEHEEYARTLFNLANLLLNTGDYAEAETKFLQVISIQAKVLGKRHIEYAKSLASYADLLILLGRYSEVKSLYLEALSIQEKVLSKENIFYSMTLANFARFLFLLERYEEAEPLVLEVLSIQEIVLGKQSGDYAKSLGNLGAIFNKTNNYIKSMKFLLEAKNIQETVLGKEHPDYALSLVNLASLYLAMGRYDESEAIGLEAKSIFEKIFDNNSHEYFILLHNLLLLYETTNRRVEAEQLQTQYNLLTQSLLLQACKYLSEKELSDYISTFERDINRDLSFIQARPQNPGTLPSICYDNALFHKGFLLNAASQMRRLAMQDTASAKIYDLISSKQFLISREYTKPIADRLPYVRQWEEEANTLEKELVRTVPGYESTITPVSWRDVQTKLKPGEAVIEFVYFAFVLLKPTDSTLYAALVLLPNDTAPHFMPLCEQRQLDALIPERKGPMPNYLQNLYASPRADGLASLHQLIWTPIDSLLRERGIQTVYYSPSGMLHRLNLAAVSVGVSDSTLADRYRLVPMGSTRSLAVGTKESSLAVDAKARQLVNTRPAADGIRINDALIYGGVRYDMDSTAIARANGALGAVAQDTTGGLFQYSDRSGTRGDVWGYLLGTEKEANYLHDLLTRRGIKSTRRLGYEATEESFKQIGQKSPSPSLLHIATHGFFFPDPKTVSSKQLTIGSDREPVFKISEHPMIRSGLLLAGANHAWKNGRPLSGGHEDGILTAHEVSQMNLSNTELVVLSACETGLGDIKGNEGVYGLQRAFRIAGAKNVLMSLWKVPDEATEKLMTRFYQNWLEEKMPLREAFEAAQKWLREQKGYENPYFWAGFVLIGE